MTTIFNTIFKADTKELDDATKKVSDLGEKIPGLKGRLGELKEVFGHLAEGIKLATTGITGMIAAVGLAVAALAGLGVAMAFKYTDIIDDLGDLGAQYGMTATQVLVMKNAAEGTSSSLEAIQAVYVKVATNMTSVGGEIVKASASMKLMGVDALDSAGHLKTQQQVTLELIDSWEHGNKTAEDYSAMMALMGKKFQEVIPAIKAAAEAEKMRQEFEEKGIFISKESVEIAGDNVDANSKLSLIFADMGSIMVETVIPAFVVLKNWLVESYTNGGLVAGAFTAIEGATIVAMAAFKVFVQFLIGADLIIKTITHSVGALAAVIANPGSYNTIWKLYKQDIIDLGKEADAASAKLWATHGHTAETTSTTGPAGDPEADAKKAKEKLAAEKAHQAALKERMRILMELARINNAAFDAEEKEQQKIIDGQESAIKSIREHIEQVTFENSLYGKTKAEITALTIARQLEKTGLDSQTAGVKKLTDALIEQNKVAADHARLAGLIASTDTAKTEQFVENIRVLDEAFFNGEIAINAYNEAINNVTGNNKKATETQKGMWDDLISSVDGYTQRMAGAFVDFASGAQTSFKSLIAGILKEIATMLMSSVFKEFTDAIKGGAAGTGSSSGGWLSAVGSAIGSFFASNNGNVFQGGMPVTQHALGGVVSSPTTFPMSNGGMGSMAETDPEAIMPLQRNASGQLGVLTTGGKSSGGNYSVVVENINVNADQTTDGNKVGRQVGEQIKAIVLKTLHDERRPGNSMNPVAAGSSF